MEQRAGHITPTNRTLNGRNACLLVLGSISPLRMVWDLLPPGNGPTHS